MAIGRSRLASFSSEPAKPTLFQASIENSDPTIAAPITGHSAAPRPPAGQNPGPKFASIAAALRPIVIPRRMSAASAVVLMAVSDVLMTAAGLPPRTLVPVNTITDRIARSPSGEWTRPQDARRDDEDPGADHGADHEGRGIEPGERFDEVGPRLLRGRHRAAPCGLSGRG